MPRARLTRDDVVAGLADEIGYHNLTMGLLAQRLGVRAPSLYKHADDLADLQHRLATRAMTELGEAVRDAIQGRRPGDGPRHPHHPLHHPGLRRSASRAGGFQWDADPGETFTWMIHFIDCGLRAVHLPAEDAGG